MQTEVLFTYEERLLEAPLPVPDSPATTVQLPYNPKAFSYSKHTLDFIFNPKRWVEMQRPMNN